MPGDVDHVVVTAKDEPVAIGVTLSPIERAVKPLTRHLAPVGIHETLVVAPQRLQTAWRQWPRCGDHHFESMPHMPVDSAMAQIGRAAGEPAGEWRV